MRCKCQRYILVLQGCNVDYFTAKREAPIFSSLLPDTIDIAEGEEAAFECTVTGHPQPRVSWTRDGRSLSVLSTETSYENGELMSK